MRIHEQRAPYHHGLLLLLSFCASRLALLKHLDSPVFGWRPTDLGAIALGFYHHGFRLLYPQVLWGADGPGYVEMEFPLVPYVTALLFRIFGVHEVLQLVIPLASGLGLVWLTYVWGARYFDRSVALAAGVLVALCPTLAKVTDTGLWADPPMVLFASLGLYCLARWVDEAAESVAASAAWLVSGCVCVALAILMKLTALYIGIPIAYLFFKKYGVACYRRPLAWLAGAAMLLPSLLWYLHAHSLFVHYHNTFGIVGAGYSKFGSAQLLGHTTFYVKTALRIALYHLTPLGALACAWGALVCWRRRSDSDELLTWWLLAVGCYVLVAAGGVWDGHYHYLLPILPPLSLAASVGALDTLRRLRAGLEARQRGAGWPLIASALSLLFVVNAAAATYRFEHGDRMFDDWIWEKKKRTGQRLKPLLRENSLLLVSDGQMDALPPERSMTPPDVFYFADRRGWYLSLAWLSVDRIETLRARGAGYFVVSGQSVGDFRQKHGAIFDYLARHYTKLFDDDDGVAFDLDTPARVASAELPEDVWPSSGATPKLAALKRASADSASASR